MKELFNRTSLFLLLFAVAHCAEIFVQSGATGGNGTSGNPYGSIQQALTAASSNDIITLYNGTYTGTPNTVLSLGSLTNITIRGFDNNPLTTIIQWSVDSADSFLNITHSSPTVKIQGLGFSSRVLVDNPNYLPYGAPTPTIYLGSGSLNIVNCRFSDFSTTSSQSLEVLYVLIKGGATATFTNTDFLRGQGILGISLEDGRVAITSCNFVLHTVGTSGSCAAIRPGNNTEPANMTITNTNFVSSSTPIRFTKGTAVLSSNNFYNCTNISPSCTNAIITSTGNKFCGSSVGACAQLSVSNIRPFDGCGICDGTNIHKDCNGVCWGTSRSSSCTTKKTIWVSPNGGGDGTARNKTLSISAAISQANYGDTIILLSGNYSGGITTAGKTGITIRSENGLPDYDNVTITCSASNKNAFTFSNQESFDNVLQGFTITNCGNSTTNAVYIGANTGITIRSVKFHLNGDLLSSGAAIYLMDGFVRVTDVTFQNNTAFTGSIVYGNTSNVLTKATYFSATNTRFIKNYVDDRGNIYFNGGLIEISNSYFIYGDAYVQTASIFANSTYLKIVNNSFSNVGLSAGSPRNIECSFPRNDSTQSLNTFCGSATTSSILCSVFGAQTLSGTPDACGVCNGNNATRDCSGTCFGSQSTDNKTVCCFSPSRDCGGYCYGPNRLDVNTTCCDSSLIDACNICGGDDSCLCDLSYNPFAPLCANAGFCVPAPKNVSGAYCDCSLSGGYFGPLCTDFSCTPSCDNRGNCTSPNFCTCNTALWTGNNTGCTTAVCSYPATTICNGGYCISPGVCSCDGTNYTSACPVIPSVSASPSRSPSRSPTPSPSASPSTGASSSPTSSPASSVAVSPSSSAAPSISPSSADTTSSSSGTEKGTSNPVEGPTLIAIIVVAVVAFLALLIAIIAFVWRRRQSGVDRTSQELQVAAN